jgi:hypothetical protein
VAQPGVPDGMQHRRPQAQASSCPQPCLGRMPARTPGRNHQSSAAGCRGKRPAARPRLRRREQGKGGCSLMHRRDENRSSPATVCRLPACRHTTAAWAAGPLTDCIIKLAVLPRHVKQHVAVLEAHHLNSMKPWNGEGLHREQDKPWTASSSHAGQLCVSGPPMPQTAPLPLDRRPGAACMHLSTASYLLGTETGTTASQR